MSIKSTIIKIVKGAENVQSLLFAMVFLFIASLLLISNEVTTIKHSNNLSQMSQVVSLNYNEPVNLANNGKLVHISGIVMSMDTIEDDLFKVQTTGITLLRNVEMYQWQQQTDSSKSISESGRTYFKKVWSSEVSAFTDDEHKNPSWPLYSEIFYADNIKMGEFTIAQDLIETIQNRHTISLDNVTIPEQYKDKMQVEANMLTMKNNINKPEIGDIRVSFLSVKPNILLSIIARQNDSLLEADKTTLKQITIVREGAYNIDEIFQIEVSSNRFTKWFTRLFGFVFMLVPAYLLQRPLINVVQMLPGLAGFASAGSKHAAWIIAILLTMTAIISGWIIAYIPFVQYIILALFAAAFMSIMKKLSHSRSLIGKIVFFVLSAFILLLVIAFMAFLYLTRA